jgi:hypothetical protein
MQHCKTTIHAVEQNRRVLEQAAITPARDSMNIVHSTSEEQESRSALDRVLEEAAVAVTRKVDDRLAAGLALVEQVELLRKDARRDLQHARRPIVTLQLTLRSRICESVYAATTGEEVAQCTSSMACRAASSHLSQHEDAKQSCCPKGDAHRSVEVVDCAD